MAEVLLFSSILSPVVMALVQLFKQINVPKTIIPIVAVVVGVLVGYAATPFTDLDVTLRLWSGGLAGLASTGLFELVTPSNGKTQGGEK